MNATTDSNSTIPAVPLAVVGIGCLFPKAEDKSTFWANIKHKVDAITDVPETHWRISDYYDPDPKRPDHTYGKRGGFLDPVDFNPLEFNIQPNILEAIDTSQLLGLIAAREALRDAGYDPAGEFARERVSVLLGVTGALEMVIPLGARLGYPIWRKALLDSGVPADVADEVVERISAAYVPWQENSFPGLLGNVVAGRISKQFNLGGSNSVVDAACGSSLSAVHMAAMELACGHADMVITGGIDTFNDIFMYTCFSKTPALSPSNRVCPFDESSDGTLIGEGLGLVTLKRLEDAERDNDHIYAVIKGVGSGSDGKGGAIYEPSARGQVRTLRNAHKIAGVEPRDIGLIEAHGTGTRVGDATEIKALREVFGESDGSPWCALGSVKSQIGHAKAAAGAAGLIKTVLALHTKILPPTINVSKPQEIITSGNTPFYVNTEARPWITSADRPRLAGVSAFGFGGSNYHCILEEYRHHKRFCDWDGAPQVLAWSGSTPDELKNNIQKSLAGLRENLSSRKLRAIGAEVRSAYDINAPQRLSCCIEDSHQGATILEQALTLVDSGKEQASTPTGIYYCGKSADISPVEKTAVLFPGQGAQYPYMLRDLACHAPEMLEELERADVALNHECPEPLSTLIYPHSIYTDADAEKAAQKLQATEHAQPAIGTVSLGAWRYLQRYGVEAGAFAGHSYGELTALCAAGCYTAHDLYSLSRLRGTLMRGDGSDKGTMLAVAAPLEDIEELIKKEDLELVIANKNTPQQGVLSGARAEIERAATACKNAGMRCTPLDVAAAFHSSLVAGAATPFRAELEHVKINTPKAKVYANKSAATYPQDEDGIRTLLAEQLASPVEFVRQIEQMYADGITTFIEVGPGARLSGMVKKILAEKKDVNIITLDASNGKRMGMNDLGRCVAQLAALGIAPNLHVWDEGFASRWLNRPEENSRKPRMSIPICGANYVKEREPLPRSTRTLVDRRELEALKNQQTPQGTGSGHENIGSRTDMNTSDTDTNNPPQGVKTPVSAEILHAQMRMLHKIQEDTARLHEQFLSGQSEALRTMRALMGDVQSTGIEMDSALPKSASEREQPREAAPQETTVNQPQPVPSGVPDARAETASGTQRDNPPEADTDIASELLKIVAEKTGYPQEMLELDMSLDADLGIDSIKRVEILSAVQEQLPHLPSVEPQQLSALQTLRQIVDTLSSAAGQTPPSPQTDAHGAGPASAPITADTDVASELLAIVAEKTGYPQEMLELDMSLDADLGIDSIKRVEILSAVQEQLPHLPSVEPQQLSALQTLRQIVDTLSSAAGQTQPSPQADAHGAGPASAPPTADTDVASELLAIVAEKTGYPQEMLELDMSLDADLGIDSIKRVEILSAVQEQLPHLPSVEPQQLSALQTLRQIVDTLEAESGKKKDLNADPSADSSRAPITAPHTGIERQVIRLCAVEAKQGKLDIKAPIWIVDDASPLSEGVAQALESKGYASKVVSPFITRIPEHLGGLVIPAPVMGADSNFIRDAFALLQRCAPALHAAATEGDAVFFTLSRLDGAFGFDPESLLHDPISGGLAGLSKTAAHEWKDITCRALDIDPLLPEQEQINAVVQELEHAGPQEIGISRCGIFTPVLQNESLPSESPELNLSRADVVIISGGGRGVTAEVALHLAQHSSPTLLLLGRSPLEEEEEWLRSATTEAEIKQTLVKNSPEKLNPRELNAQCQSVLNQRELRRNIERLQQAGSQVLYHALDIRDEEAVKTAVEAARSHGAIRGIIHGAGVLADKRIEDKTLEQFDQVYSTKIGGLQAIIQATAADEVDFIALFSSSTGRFGRTGQIDYAVANEVLNKTAQALARQYPQRRILSLNWGPWDGGMVNTGLKKLFASEGIEVIDLEEGSRYLLQELGGSAKEVELVILGGGTVLQPGNDSGVNECQNVSDQLPNPVMQMPVSCTHLPCLRDHVIDAKAVVPMALSAEWLAQGAMHNFPGLAFFGFDNLRIYRGITLNRDEEQQIELRCDRMEPVAAQRGIYRVAVQICDAKSATVFSSAEVVLADTLPQEIPEPISGDISAANQENRDSIYADSRLFHGPAFQALEQVLGQDEKGISALASNAATPAAWIKTPLRHTWLGAPMLLDSSFQLMILWCSTHCGCVSLPSSVRCYRQYVEHIPGDVSEIRAHVIRCSASGAEADIDFITPDTGKLLARIEGYVCTMTPSLQDAFTRDTLD